LNFFRTPRLLPIFYPRLEWRVKTIEKVIYLTFDDGPVPGPTEFVLDVLKRTEVKATFFCIGDNVRKHPGIYRQIIGAGHAVGNHTYNHLKGWVTGRAEYIENVQKCESQLFLSEQIPSSSLFRPPYGRITRRQIQALSDFKIVMWDVLTHDYNQRIKKEECLRGSIRATRPGSIVVFHDSLKAERNMMYALPQYIEYFQSAGFRFEMLTHE
jgi:peptidoglycan-N-acetylglucosamine deacetylase